MTSLVNKYCAEFNCSYVRVSWNPSRSQEGAKIKEMTRERLTGASRIKLVEQSRECLTIFTTSPRGSYTIKYVLLTHPNFVAMTSVKRCSAGTWPLKRILSLVTYTTSSVLHTTERQHGSRWKNGETLKNLQPINQLYMKKKRR